MTRFCQLAFAAALVATSAGAARADTPADAEELYRDGQSAYDAGDYDKAIAAWQRSYDISDEPALLFNLGQAHRLRGKPGDCTLARAAYTKFLAHDPAPEQRTATERFLASIQACAAREDERAEPTTTPPATALPAPQPPSSVPVDEPGRRRSLRIAGLSLGAGGIALVATGLYFGHRARALGDEVTTECASGCDWGVYRHKQDDGQRAQTLQWVGYATGVAALVAGGALYWLGSRAPAASRLALVPRPDGGTVTWVARW